MIVYVTQFDIDLWASVFFPSTPRILLLSFRELKLIVYIFLMICLRIYMPLILIIV